MGQHQIGGTLDGIVRTWTISVTLLDRIGSTGIILPSLHDVRGPQVAPK